MKLMWNWCEFKPYGFRIWITTKKRYHEFILVFHLRAQHHSHEQGKMIHIVNMDTL